MIRFITLFFVVLMLAVPRAFAGDPFTVGGITVDATAATAIEAQTKAIQDGQLRAATALINRMTQESDRAAHPLPVLTPELVGRMIRALEVGQERRSANRYLGEITVAFNPSQVQQFLRDNQLTLVSSQARERLVVVQEDGLRGSSGELLLALSNPRLSYALTPLRAASLEDNETLVGTPSEEQLKSLGEKYGLNQVLLVDARGGGLSANVTDISLDSGNTETFSISGAGSANDFADQLVARLETDWKAASSVGTGELVTTPVSVLYGSHLDWITLQEAINTSAQIKGARLDALSKDGALMTISYGGDIQRLTTELRFKGVRVRQDPELGLVFTRA